MKPVAIIVGGAEIVWDEVIHARNECAAVGADYTLLLCNDMIECFPESGIGVTLHPAKLKDWLAKRRANDFPRLTDIWAHRAHPLASKCTNDWGGSVGLFAPKIARWELGFTKIVLCGVPMTGDNHFKRKAKWMLFRNFRRSWNEHMQEIKPFFRSMSGWTAEQLGKPTREWLAS